MKGRRLEKRCAFNRRKNRWEIIIPKKFSLLSNTDETLEVICSLIHMSQFFNAGEQLNIDHRACEEMDLAASAFLDVIVLEIWKELRKTAFTIEGTIPKKGRVSHLMVSIGLPKQLGIKIEPDPSEFIIPLPLQLGSRQTLYRQQSDAEKVATKLANHLKECFNRSAGYELPTSVIRQILNWFSEVINNAEDHSLTDDWWAISYLVPLNPTESQRVSQNADSTFLGEVQITVFNFGRSFYESLSSEDTSTELKREISDLAQQHATRRWFKKREYSERDLWTLYGLQDGVSRFANRAGATDRGWGTVRMIEAFQELGNTLQPGLTPKMVLISGDTQISFDQQYQLRDQPVEAGERGIIAFNSANTLEERPDGRYVHSLKTLFPGTLLTFRFFIDKDYLDGFTN